MNEYGIYIIKDSYFLDFQDKNLKQNKGETRPSYYAIKDKNGLIWAIPMTTEVAKMKERIKDKEDNGKRCDVFHVENLYGQERGFIIGDIFPITEEYIEREYTLSGEAVVLKDTRMIKEIGKKSKQVLKLIRRGIKLHDKQPDILSIEKKLLENIIK
ncbi:MAG: type III toxin-antitoxin system CptIN family toxin [Clostridium sp.]